MNGEQSGTTGYINIMKKWADEGFVYIWYDSINKKYYIGKHVGDPEDGYTHSSTVMEDFTTNNIPKGFRRRILFSGTKEEIAFVENTYLKNRKSKCWDRYYNVGLGDPKHCSMEGENNNNYKTGRYTGRLQDRELSAKLDRENHLKNWPTGKKSAKPRMLFYHYKRLKREEEARYWWNAWYAERKKTGFKAKQKKALWKDDTFEMWYYRIGNELDFRTKYCIRR